MNIFGLFFTFSIPAFVLGMMTMAAIYRGAKEKRRAATRRMSD